LKCREIFRKRRFKSELKGFRFIFKSRFRLKEGNEYKEGRKKG